MSMLNPKVIPTILYHALSNGVETAILCNSTGAVLSSYGQLQDEAFVSAVVASVWQNCQPPSGARARELEMCLLDCMSSRVAVGSCGSYLVFLIAQRDVEFGLLSLKLKAIRDCLSPSFEQLDAALAADDVQQKAGECCPFDLAYLIYILEYRVMHARVDVLFQSDPARWFPRMSCFARPRLRRAEPVPALLFQVLPSPGFKTSRVCRFHSK
jgi:hypothetical protein